MLRRLLSLFIPGPSVETLRLLDELEALSKTQKIVCNVQKAKIPDNQITDVGVIPDGQITKGRIRNWDEM